MLICTITIPHTISVYGVKVCCLLEDADSPLADTIVFRCVSSSFVTQAK
jgi:hypothetical protein